ncbi:helix-turn-helix domain-containing protein [Steroidobacter sp.]|uniref:helix-turn-helix domain-containing protein n=1 Tax=Steroidobacter sp. TaxID=1978227 RepID=UPI0039C99E01
MGNYRRRAGLSIQSLAERSGIPEIDIRRFERGTHAPDIAQLLRLAAAFHVPAWRIAKRIEVFAQWREGETTPQQATP